MAKRQSSTSGWSQRIQQLVGRLEITQATLAERLGVSPATVSRWIRGTHEPTAETYIALGNLAGNPEGNYFWERAGIEAGSFPDTNLRLALSSLKVNLKDFKLFSGRNLSSRINIENRSAVIIPLLNLNAYGDHMPPGPHVTLSQARIEDVLMAPLRWCPHPQNMLSMHVSGDSMEPIIPARSIISVDTAVTDRNTLQQKLTVVSHRDLGFKVARLQRLTATDILVSANHRYPPVDITDASKWKVLGQVLWWVSEDPKPRT